ncbi:MAG TPA: CRISPR-associated endonuclease Cas1 [Anaerolineae bacterium]|nr:CRISPR-associated endonuclease Cas1 [Anaerolineae bacterium]
MPTLYVMEPGSRLEKNYQRLLVVKDDQTLMRVPIQRVTQVVLVGRVGVTTPALHALLRAEIPLLMVARSGKLLGRLLPPTGGNLPLRQRQYRRNDDDIFCLELARAIVAAKIGNQRALALRLARRHACINRSDLHFLKSAIAQTKAAADMAALRGIEGMAARRYFAVYRQSFDPAWKFTRRTRRPPQDPANALLSLGYSFLTQNMMTALEAAGLDPYLGYFHAEKYNRPALALDLVEEFRPPIVDSLVLSLLNRNWLQIKDFTRDSDDKGVYLTPHGFRTFLRTYSNKLESTFKSRELGRSISYRKLFEVQARKLARVVEGKDEIFRPFRMR